MGRKEVINWNVIAKFLLKETTEEENSQVKDWFESNSKNKDEFEKIKKSLHLVELINDIDTINVESSLMRLKNKFPKHSNIFKLNRRLLLRIAASILIILSIGYGALLLNNSNKTRFVEIYSENQNNLVELLPDGSTVYLNANTYFKYTKKFDGDERKVELSGEAFFEVTPEKTKPFIIDAGKSLIKVLGTSFNVKAYKHNKKTTVSVNSGLVEVYNKNILGAEKKGLLLEEGTQGTLLLANNKIDKSEIENQNYLSWKSKIINFNQNPLYEVAEVLESVYQIKISFANDELKNLPLTATFENNNLDYVMDVILITFNIEMRKYENEILLL
ncbi:MAG: FecR domain-containing protein, partial [Bacteroidales bacterium]|nr:FecR domain-containing protein [Bacteroidales bacterium]